MVMLIAHISVGESSVLGKRVLVMWTRSSHPNTHSVRAGARLTSGVTSAVETHGIVCPKAISMLLKVVTFWELLLAAAADGVICAVRRRSLLSPATAASLRRTQRAEAEKASAASDFVPRLCQGVDCDCSEGTAETLRPRLRLEVTMPLLISSIISLAQALPPIITTPNAVATHKSMRWQRRYLPIFAEQLRSTPWRGRESRRTPHKYIDGSGAPP
jgi:hypothetical protein